MKNSGSMNAANVVVPAELCIGCGVCAGVCPKQVLKMEFNRHGEYVVREHTDGCLDKCDLCLRVCPFWEEVHNEDRIASGLYSDEPGIHHHTETGYYVSAIAGHVQDPERRLTSASGGLATWFLATLLEKQIVDRVVCVVPNNEPGKLFQFQSFSNSTDLRKAGRSCYYPVELSQIVREIMQTEGRYAIIGLPCFLKALRSAMRANAILRKRITLLAGLVCGQTKSKFFAEYLCALAGGIPGQMVNARFRVKDSRRESTDFGFQFECSGGPKTSGEVFWTEGMGDAWCRGYFKPNACDFCDDVFAEVADLVFMDAWVEPYVRERRGTNLVLFRRQEMRRLFDEGHAEEKIYCEDVAIDRVITSQGAVIEAKRAGLAKRLGVERALPWRIVPGKRVQPAGVAVPELVQLHLERLMRRVSRRVLYSARGSVQPGVFQAWMSAIYFFLKAVAYSRVKGSRLGFHRRG